MFIKVIIILSGNSRVFLPICFRKFPQFWKFWKILGEFPENVWWFFCGNTRIQSKNLFFCMCKLKENRGKFRGGFGKISEILKMREKSPRKFHENFAENSRKIGVSFNVKYNFTERKSICLCLYKQGTSRKISGKFQGKFPKFWKLPEELSPENFPEIPGVFFRLNTMIQSENLSFYFYKK